MTARQPIPNAKKPVPKPRIRTKEATASKVGGAREGAGRKPAARAAVKKSGYDTAMRILGGEVRDGGFAGKGAVDDPDMPELPRNATPLDVMIEAMRRAYKLGGPIAAFPYAEKAAPYLHAKISSIELKTPSPAGSSGAGARFVVEFVKANQATEDTPDA